MQFRLLGPFEARHEGRPLAIGRRRQERCLLAILLLEADRVVPVARLIDLLWDGEPPASARGVIHTYVGRLRGCLRSYGPRIDTRGDGYLFHGDQHRVDSHEFVALAGQADGAVDPLRRIALYERALALWRGPLLADLAGDGLRERVGAALIDLRLSTSERLAAARLEVGQHDRVVSELAPLVEQHPTRERLVGELMTALYRCGRRTEALHRYQITGDLLRLDLGVEPGPDLRGLHDRILRDDPGLDRPARRAHAVRVGDQMLPLSVGGHPALDFCNTYAGWGGPRLPGSEWLRGYAALAAWVGHVGLADDATVARLIRQARHEPLQAAGVLDEARALRAHVYACLTGPDDRRAFDEVARVAESAARVSRFVRDDDGLGRWRCSSAAGLRLPVYAAARSAADLLADARRFTVRVCPGVDCGWLFLDQSGLRRFCGAGGCGRRPAAVAPDRRPTACQAGTG